MIDPDLFHAPICQLCKNLFGIPNPCRFLLTASYHCSWSQTYEPREAGITSVSPLKYFTAASPLPLAVVVMWNVRPPLFLQRNLIRVKCKWFLSSFIALFVSTIALLLTLRYDVLTGNWVGDEPCETTLDTRSHPPEIRWMFIIGLSVMWAKTSSNVKFTIIHAVSLINFLHYCISQANCTVPQLIPRDRKWSSDRKWSPKWTASDHERKIWEWPRLTLLVHRVTFIIATKRINSTELI